MDLSVFESRQMVEAKSFGVWKFKECHKVDVQGTLDDPYFNGKDICAVLEYSDPTKAMWEILNEDEKIQCQR